MKESCATCQHFVYIDGTDGQCVVRLPPWIYAMLPPMRATPRTTMWQGCDLHEPKTHDTTV